MPDSQPRGRAPLPPDGSVPSGALALGTLPESEQLYRLLAKHSTDVISTHTPDGVFRYVSPASRRLLGYAPEELVGRSVYELFHPDDRGRVREVHDQVLQSPVVGRVEFRIRVDDGRYIWFETTAQMVRDPETNAVREVVAVSRDVSERREAEAALRESAARFRAVAETLPQVLWTARPDGAIDYFNPRWSDFTERPVEEGLGWEWKRYIHPEDEQRTLDRWMHSVRTGDPYRIEHRVRWRDGTFRWHLSQARPLRDEHGRVTEWFGTGTDIHEQKQAEETQRRACETAEAASRAKSEFLATMSHELRTPLNAIIGYEEILEEEFAGPLNAQQKHHLSRIRESSWHLLGLIDEVLTLARIEAGREELHPEVVDAAALARDAAAMVQPQAARKGLRLFVGAPETPLLLRTDPSKLRQILLNLLSNAVKFTDAGEVEARVWADRGVCFEVRDTGGGIAPEHLERIWEPFTQVDQSTTRRVGGTGLGLPVSRRLARLLGGELSVRSQSGAGSTFLLRFPPECPGVPDHP